MKNKFTGYAKESNGFIKDPWLEKYINHEIMVLDGVTEEATQHIKNLAWYCYKYGVDISPKLPPLKLSISQKITDWVDPAVPVGHWIDDMFAIHDVEALISDDILSSLYDIEIDKYSPTLALIFTKALEHLCEAEKLLNAIKDKLRHYVSVAKGVK